jgi:hypothetical protein
MPLHGLRKRWLPRPHHDIFPAERRVNAPPGGFVPRDSAAAKI